ncbi:MAG: flap endonuclease [Acidimicrobiia bacterium]|nr:flap endonuclease [Acidimicrobiia bacterium]
MRVHLVDGTYELFRYYFALPSHVTGDGREVGATRGVLHSLLMLLEEGATHVGVATDHVIESFRNELYQGYKDGSGLEPDIVSQFPILEEVLAAAGFVVWPMVEFEADDALGAAAVRAADDPDVEQVLICTPDKDLAQCVREDGRIVQLDRRKGHVYDRAGVIEKFGVAPESIADYLGLVGDSADGFPGLPGWGAKSSSAVLARYIHIEDVPASSEAWDVSVRGAAKLARTLQDHLDEALLFRRIATLELDAPTFGQIDELRWTGPRDDVAEVLASVDATDQLHRIDRLTTSRAP